eukprot:CAMPEP_0197441778 /NCGR_PEP_ID=MMETSP1175-20131217/7961_1 /TAXON_ID=1003142 /ORGANISM="Triceratium dubium, Strain CCMP147" /LENGTH=197 /DNA_ID=CAMNT_0042972109 /DNA_START=43 /DNA_END=633 /DNA_ORIENTATION=+
MRALLICVGSRGDNEPFASLAATLIANGCEVDMFVQSDAIQLVPPPNGPLLRCHELPFTQMDFYRYVSNPSHGQDHSNPRVKFLGIITDCIGELVLPCTKAVLDVAKERKPDVILASSLSRQLAMAVGDEMGSTICWVQLQPLTPTKHYPHYSQHDSFIDALLAMDTNADSLESSFGEKNIETYCELERYQYEFLKE